MSSFSRLSRRDFLVATSSVLAPSFAFGDDYGGLKSLTPSALGSASADVEIELIAKRDSVRILEGASTPVWRYVGRLIKGPQNTLSQLGDSYLGPIMRFVKGQKIRINLRNELPQQTIAHWHGLHVPMAADGHPASVIDPGQSYIYDFEMLNRASMNFYHPHPHEETATQVYRGLAGLIIVEDDEERALGLPSGEYEIPLVIQDRAFNAANQLVYGGMMGGGMGLMSMAHPIHLHGQPFQIISRTFEGNTDSYATVRDGFLDVGLKDTVIVSPGERIRIVKPFNNFKGRFMYHCHNLEHEDMGMMREFLVE